MRLAALSCLPISLFYEVEFGIDQALDKKACGLSFEEAPVGALRSEHERVVGSILHNSAVIED
jgi:hypothetical protein